VGREGYSLRENIRCGGKGFSVVGNGIVGREKVEWSG
jgi:hypothetical protein